MPRKAIETSRAVSTGPYSPGTEAGEMIYLSGQTPIDPITGKLVTGSVGEQAVQCFKNLLAVLQEVELTFDDVVKVNVFLTDMNDFAEMNAVYAQHFSKPYPARTTIAVVALPLGADIEIEMVARRG